MKADAVSFDDELDELEDFDDEDGEEERGLSGLVVLLMGVVMLGALASVVWIAYKQGIRNGQAQGGAPYVTADPEPLKIENTVADAANGDDLAVYDRLGGQESEPVETIAAGPEEPVARASEDPIGAIAAQAGSPAGLADDAVADRIAALAKADEALNASPPATAAPSTPAPKPEAKPATPPTAASTTPKPTISYASGALSGSHLVQVGAFRSEEEAGAQWAKLQGKLGEFLSGKDDDVERADLGDKGVYYRLRIGPFASSDDAKTFCAGLKDRGTDCLIKAK
ncbi:MAG: SPOR domain-containing protein [Parvularculaceae bacterium]